MSSLEAFIKKAVTAWLEANLRRKIWGDMYIVSRFLIHVAMSEE